MQNKGQKYFVRIFVFVAVFAIIPVFVSAAMFYRSAARQLREQVDESSAHFIDEIVYLTEMILDRVQEIGHFLFYYPEYADYIAVPGRYETLNLRAPYAEGEMKSIYRYISVYGELARSLSGAASSNDLIDSIFMLDPESGIVLGADTGITKASAFFDQAWIKRAGFAEPVPVLIPARNVLTPDGNPRRFITTTSIDATSGIAFALNVDAFVLHRHIVRRMGRSGEALSFFALGPTGNPELAAERSNPLYDIVRSAFVLSGGQGDTLTLDYQGDRVLVARKPSAELGWTFYSVFRMDAFYGRLMRVQVTTVFLNLGIVSILIGAAFLSARRLYRPVESLLAFLPNRAVGEKGQGDEFSVIRNVVTNILNEDRKLEQQIRDSLPLLRERFILSILEGTALSPQEIEHRMNYLEIRCGVSHLLPVVLKHEPHGESRKMAEIQVTDLQVSEIVQQVVLSAYDGTFIHTVDCCYCLVLQCRKPDLPDIYSRASRLIERAHVQTGLWFSVGVGEICPSVYELPDSYRRAAASAQFGMVYRNFDVFSWEDLPAPSADPPLRTLSAETLGQYRVFLGSGDRRRARQALAVLFENIMERRDSIDTGKLRQFFIRLLADLLDLIDDLGIEYEAIFPETVQPFDTVYRMASVTEYRTFLMDATDRMAQAISAKSSEKTNRHIHQIMNLLDEDHGVTVNLNTVSEKLQLNPSYVSRLFRAECGVTFTQFLTELRLTKAKGLLAETDKTVKEIGRSVGYWNVAYFTSLFKEKTGLTPTEYRSLHSLGSQRG